MVKWEDKPNPHLTGERIPFCKRLTRLFTANIIWRWIWWKVFAMVLSSNFQLKLRVYFIPSSQNHVTRDVLGPSLIFMVFKIDNSMLGLRWELSSNRLTIFEIESKERWPEKTAGRALGSAGGSFVFSWFFGSFWSSKKNKNLNKYNPLPIINKIKLGEVWL